jgi:hypothetical protein
MDWAPDGTLILVTADGVLRLQSDSGATLGTLITAGSGGLTGPTFVAILANPTQVDASQVGTQFWISGAGRLESRQLVVDAMLSTTGPAFGADFDPLDRVASRWGKLWIEFDSCSSGTLHWDSTGADSAGFGTGNYPVTRFLPGAGAQRCEQVGFLQSPPEDWLQGTWSGGVTRDGEGLVLEYFNASTVVVAWFTHRPATAP